MLVSRPSSGLDRLPTLALGTAQFGMSYGIAGRPQVQPQEVREILRFAWKSGIDTLDTAPAYGVAERVVGSERPQDALFAIVSKTQAIRSTRIASGDLRSVVVSAMRSRDLVAVASLDTLLVHHAADLLQPGADELYAALVRLQQARVTRRIGVSVYDVETLNAILARFRFQVVQLPLSILDQRFVNSGAIASLARQGIEVHARSVFLQGLLLKDSTRLPARFSESRALIARFQSMAIERELSFAAAALNFVSRVKGVTKIVIGVDGITHLRDNIEAFIDAASAPSLPDPESYACNDPTIIDPRCW